VHLLSRNPSHYPVSVAVVAGLTTLVVYGVITASWILGGNGDPSGGWSLHLTSAALQVVGWSFLSFLVAQLVAALHRKMKPPQTSARQPNHPRSTTRG